MMFALFMIVVLLVTGLIWLFDILVLSKKRPAGADEPVLVEYAKSFFPVILVVFLVRSFIVEPFKIPSGSMMPTLLAGDFILVNKFTYGLRVPILNNTFLPVNRPARGDVIVFHYPPNPSIDYIKRVVGLPGDKIGYQDKRLTINGQPVAVESAGYYEYVMSGLNVVQAKQYHEQLGSKNHDILVHNVIGNYDADTIGAKFAEGEEVTVPDGQYLAMGDNRDNSSDSRVWGFVPEQNLVGKAFFIWMNFDQGSRIGNKID
ncbi:signal peptidase I [Methylotenera mobilis]|uniref:Signal peptidase I n=1 Tax=Methylotenera mobilis (strain JLW8 / ATCC BAA-1282 / DSM 17540) TaxID=583345 RepID=C6WX90_METML|nr:signal peptidase I [Methylotenera mobilis]ACT48539.1 signal peptidase I [Methylotenera mobilis JLW8]